MDWDGVIEGNTQALRRVLAALVAMAGLGSIPSSPLVGLLRKGADGLG